MSCMTTSTSQYTVYSNSHSKRERELLILYATVCTTVLCIVQWGGATKNESMPFLLGFCGSITEQSAIFNCSPNCPVLYCIAIRGTFIPRCHFPQDAHRMARCTDDSVSASHNGLHTLQRIVQYTYSLVGLVDQDEDLNLGANRDNLVVPWVTLHLHKIRSFRVGQPHKSVEQL